MILNMSVSCTLWFFGLWQKYNLIDGKGKAASYLKMEAVGCFDSLVRSYRFTWCLPANT